MLFVILLAICIVAWISVSMINEWNSDPLGNRNEYRRPKNVRFKSYYGLTESQAIATAEVTTIMEKAQRYVDEQSDKEELSASTPMLISIASEIGLLSPKQVIAFRRTVTLDMEMRKTGNKEKAQMAISACKEALNVIGK